MPWRTGAIDHVQLDPTPEQPRPGVQLLRGELRAQLAGRTEEAGRPVQRHDKGNVNRDVPIDANCCMLG